VLFNNKLSIFIMTGTHVQMSMYICMYVI